MHSTDGRSPYLDRDNCRVENKSKNSKEDAVILKLKRESDGEEGKSYLRVQDRFESLSGQLLAWVFASKNIVGLTLNQLADFETNLSVESIGGKLQLRN